MKNHFFFLSATAKFLIFISISAVTIMVMLFDLVVNFSNEEPSTPMTHLSGAAGVWVAMPEIKSTINNTVSDLSPPPIPTTLRSVTVNHKEITFDFLDENGASTIVKGHVYEGKDDPVGVVGALYLPALKPETTPQERLPGRLYGLWVQTEPSPHWKGTGLTVVKTDEESVMRISYIEGEKFKTVYLILQP